MDKNITLENLQLFKQLLDEHLVVNLTYAQLKSLRDNNQLIPGQQYRITDYVATTTQTNTSSAGHQFDLIVVADTNNKLNESARACRHEGDTYFANNDLEAWELKYSLDNDINRFAWADVTNGKGVIYWLKDEFHNEAPYDFKNMLSSFTIDSVSYSVYTFNYVTSTVNCDASLVSGTSQCHDNFIGEYRVNGVLTLNRTVFFSTSSMLTAYDNNIAENNHDNLFKGSSFYNNVIGTNCYSNDIGSSFYNNSIGDSFDSNSIGSNFYNNTIDRYFAENAINSEFYSNIIGCRFYDNTVDAFFYANVIGIDFRSNTIGSNVSYNAIGNNFRSNAIGSYFTYNAISNNFYSNTIGSYFSYSTIGNDFVRNIVGSSASQDVYVRHCKFDDGVQCISLTSADTSATWQNYLQNVHVHVGVQGASTSNRLIISVPDRDLSYSCDYYATNSQSFFI